MWDLDFFCRWFRVVVSWNCSKDMNIWCGCHRRWSPRWHSGSRLYHQSSEAIRQRNSTTTFVINDIAIICSIGWSHWYWRWKLRGRYYDGSTSTRHWDIGAHTIIWNGATRRHVNHVWSAFVLGILNNYFACTVFHSHRPNNGSI